MAQKSQATLRVVSDSRSPLVIESSALGMLIFVVAEVMLFAGLISAFMIVRSSAPVWPPAGQPRLPVGETAFNTAVLLLSGCVLFFAQRAYKRQPGAASRPLLLAIGLGAFFVIFQGIEWVALVREGLTLVSGAHGGFFYLIVGMHALHAVAALIALSWAWLRLSRRRLPSGTFSAVQILWYFVVGLWPILYWRVYL